MRQSGTSFVAHNQSKVALQLTEPICQTRTNCRINEPLSECPTTTSRIHAPEPTGRYPDEHLSTTRGQIAQLANIATMHAPGDQTTRRAPRRAAVRIRINDHLIGRGRYTLHTKAAGHE